MGSTAAVPATSISPSCSFVSGKSSKISAVKFSCRCQVSLETKSNYFVGGASPSFSQVRNAIIAKSKFEQFGKNLATEVVVEEESSTSEEDYVEVPQDGVLPNDLQDAVIQASKAASLFALGNGPRAIVEILVPDLEVMGEEGAQQLLWDSSKSFVESMAGQLAGVRIKAIYPDAGSAALLTHKWKDAPFSIGSLSDRKPVEDSDDVVVLVAPDFQMLENVQRIADTLTGEEGGEPRTLIMWNPRLVSGDVGVGLNVRRLRENFLSTFVSVYHLRPLSSGAIFRSYPQPWKLFLDDPDRPGRYLLYREQMERPDLDDIEDLFMAVPGVEGEEESEGPSLATRAAGFISSLSRFMKALSN